MRAYISEFIGTYGLVFFGTGAVLVNDLHDGTIGIVGIAIAFGLAVLTMIYAFGETSGAHINPAVTIAFWVSKRFEGRHVIPYIIAQCTGAIAASASLSYLFEGPVNLGLTMPIASAEQAFVMEVLLSFFLMFVIINVSTGSKEIGRTAAIAVGGIVMLEALVAGPITGASMNPARSLGPAIVSGELKHLWLYLTAPVLGASLAILGCRLVKGKTCCDSPYTMEEDLKTP